jgi:hypothetical protein
MTVILRRAKEQDAVAFLEIKAQLHLSRQNSRQGGFLLGTTQGRYEAFIQEDMVWVLEDVSTAKVVGFAIVLKDQTLRGSELWQKKEQAELGPQLVARLEVQKLAYYEQLACLPNYRSYAKYLAFYALAESLQDHQHVLTTVVRLPVHNRAALPFMEVLGFKPIGCIAEVYPEYGAVHSDIYYLGGEAFKEAHNLPVIQAFMKKARRYNFL